MKPTEGFLGGRFGGGIPGDSNVDNGAGGYRRGEEDGGEFDLVREIVSAVPFWAR